MQKHTFDTEKLSKQDFAGSSRSWLLHARYVRGEHIKCLSLADELQTQSGNKHAYAHYIKGLVLADTGRLQEALERFHSCIRLQPHEAEPMKQVAKCLYRQGRYQLAIETYLEANKMIKNTDPDICCAIAECCWNLNDIDRGVQWADAGVKSAGGERAGSLLARLLLARGDVQGALAAYEDTLTANACGAETLASAGALCLRAGDARRSFQLLGEALSAAPGLHAAALPLAGMLLQHRDLDAALARLRATLAGHPTCVAAHNNLGLALLAKKKFVASLTCLQRAVWTAPLSSRAAHNLGLALLVCKRTASAFCRLATAAALHPTQPYTVLLIAIALERLEDDRADSAFVRASALDPNNAFIRLNLAGRHARSGRLTAAGVEAENTARILNKNRNPDPQLASSLATLLGLLREAGLEYSTPKEEKTIDLTVINDSQRQEHFDPDEV